MFNPKEVETINENKVMTDKKRLADLIKQVDSLNND